MSKINQSEKYINEQQLCFSCKNKADSFEKLIYEELQEISQHKVHLQFKKGETIAKQGAFITHILYLKKGMVKLYKEVDYRSNLIFSIHRTGKLLGMASLFGSEHFQYSIAALEDSFVCAIDRKVVEDLIARNGKFAAKVLESVNLDLQLCRDKMVSLTMKQLNGRLADTLLYLSYDVYNKDEFELSLSRKDLAEMSGMSTMSVVRTLQEFQKEGYIENENHNIKIIDKKALHDLSQTG
ncbi:Crp/Fnr family transcriptional regulator [Salinivirga cyanobacteriivorans]